MKYQRKTRDIWHLMSNYGYGWEIECSYEDRKEAREDLKAYNLNSTGSHYLKKAREKIEEGK